MGIAAALGWITWVSQNDAEPSVVGVYQLDDWVRGMGTVAGLAISHEFCRRAIPTVVDTIDVHGLPSNLVAGWNPLSVSDQLGVLGLELLAQAKPLNGPNR